MNTATILNFINTNIKTLRPLVKSIEENKANLEAVKAEKARLGNTILAASEWLSDAEYDDAERITEDQYAWTMNEQDFTKYYTARYELLKQSDIINKLIPNIATIGPDICTDWIFQSKVISETKLLLEMFDKGNDSNLANEYNIKRREELVKAICEAVKAYCKP